MSLDDRVAERPSELCFAYGCPLLGTMTRSTSGTDEWFCFAHFEADAGRMQTLTSMIRSLAWLADAIVDVRKRHRHRDYPAAFQRLVGDIELAGRKDLLWKGSESEDQWLVRLETEMAAQLGNTRFAAPPAQQALISEQPPEQVKRVSITQPVRGASVTKAKSRASA